MLRQFASAPAKAARLAVRGPRATPTFSAARQAVAAPAFTSAAPTRQRWYSSESDAPKADAAGEAAKAGDAPAGEPLSAADAAALRKDLEAKTKEVIDWKDKYVRSVADFRNLQDRSARDMKNARDFAITSFAKDLVDTVDNFDRALGMAPEKAAESVEAAAKDLTSMVDGLRMVETVLLSTLKKHGLERFDPDGEKFNPNEHEATFMTPMPDKEHNTVFHTQQKGFKLNGRVLRAAKVGVVTNK
ncbi:mitochondrial co-chaperone [Ophiostoma piceae UAMH 11346]|uniref:GrpE protein homolog n=1 Tax=Ophiostoma piceae (strain UAMH 11346) TaxID=1262450 RepID=S3C695_OPHP1|nr:mitochondrial co-chaperone [Ophiostoma piceae UAMH 11346]